MALDAHDLSKHNNRTNLINHIHNTPIVQFARITKVINSVLVEAECAVRIALSREIYTVTLLNLSSSAMEVAVKPKVGDTVLILFLQRYDSKMFVSNEIVENPDAACYNGSAGVGILMSTAKRIADVVITPDGITSNTPYSSFFHNAVATIFAKAIMNTDDEQLISFVFGEQRPLLQVHLASVERQYGINRDDTGIEAPVTEKYGSNAPLMINSESSLTAQFKEITVKTKDLIEIGNAVGTLGAMIGELIDIIADLDTVGSPGNHKTGPVAIPKLQALKADWDQVFS